MINEKEIIEFLETNALEKLITPFRKSISEQKKSKNYFFFTEIINSLPQIITTDFDFSSGVVKIGNNSEINEIKRLKINESLKKLMPWRKGPFELFGIKIDAEWRSDLKWERIRKAIDDLSNKKILDVGCGNGYYIFRMLNHNPQNIIGVEPYLLNVAQFYSLSRFLPKQNANILPFGIEYLPENLRFFDTVFSMGVFYHRRSPFDHLIKLKELGKSGGKIVLETLIIDGKNGEVLVPEKRYAKMRNVWFIPSALTLESWLKRVNFKNIRLINITKTTEKEQRKTAWMEYESLTDFLDKKNPSLTVEGYPAPKRAIFIAEIP